MPEPPPRQFATEADMRAAGCVCLTGSHGAWSPSCPVHGVRYEIALETELLNAELHEIVTAPVEVIMPSSPPRCACLTIPCDCPGCGPYGCERCRGPALPAPAAQQPPAAEKPLDDVSSTAHPPVPSSGDLSAAATSLELEELEHDFQFCAISLWGTLRAFVPQAVEHKDGSATLPPHAWAEVKAALAECDEARDALRALSPAQSPHEEETEQPHTSPLGARRPREGTPPAMEVVE
jgi:hypothetical protein